MWYVYIIKTQKNKLYTGISTDYERRFLEHLSGIGGAKFFRSDSPESIVYLEEATSRSEALKIEAEIKKLTKVKKELLIKSFIPDGHQGKIQEK